MRLSIEEMKIRAAKDNMIYNWPDVLDTEIKAYSDMEYDETAIKQMVNYIRGCQVATNLNVANTLNELGCPHTEYVKVLLTYAQNGGRITTDEVRLIARQQCLLKLNKTHFDTYTVKNEIYSESVDEEQPWIYFTLCGSNADNVQDYQPEYDSESYVRCKISRYTGCVQYLAVKNENKFACRKDDLLLIMS